MELKPWEKILRAAMRRPAVEPGEGNGIARENPAELNKPDRLLLGGTKGRRFVSF